jgi:hypothetical protein
MKTYKIISGQRDNQKGWIALISGKDAKFGFARKFVGYRNISSSSSKHRYYDYFADLEEGNIIEWQEGYSGRRYFAIINNGELKNINVDDILRKFEEKKELEYTI